MNDFTKDELRKHVETFHQAEVAYLNKIHEGVCEFKLVEKDNLLPDICMEKVDERIVREKN